MNNIKKFSAIALTITTMAWMIGVVVIPTASAATIDELLAQIQLLQAQLLVLQGSSSTPACTFTSTLKLGSKGDSVKCLQQYLNGAGYTVSTSGAGSAGSESTYFGSKTAAAAKSWQAANSLTADGIFGANSRAKYTALVATTTTTPTTPTTPTGPFTLALASDNPAQRTVPLGSAGVEVLKFNVSGAGTLSTLTFKRNGIGATADFAASGFYLYEGSTRLTSGRSINSTSHEVSFTGLNLSVSGTKTLSLLADIAASGTATSGNYSYFTLVSAVGTPTPAGTLAGNAVTIGSSAAGTVTATSSGSVTNPKIGQQAALLAEFKLTAGSAEDISITQIALTEAGTITNSYLSNFVLKQSGTVVANASAVGSKDLVTLVFSTPYTLEKGQERVFQLYGDISGQTRSADTIIFYVDSKADVKATGKLYGFTVNPNIVGIDTSSEGQTLTIAGGTVTITFNGPITGDLAVRAQDVEVYNFTIAAANNIEIRNLRFYASTTGMIAGEGFPDMKVWDTSSNAVITSATDVTTSSNVTYTDVININAGQSKTYKVTVDVDSDNDDGDILKVQLLAFSLGDVKNLDNNQNVALADIVPNATVSGNEMTSRAPSLDVQLSSTPSSQTVVRGVSNISLVGISFRAISADIKLSSVKITASSTVGALTSGEVQSLGLYDGSTLVGSLKSLAADGNAFSATFDGLNQTIAKGTTKTLTLKGNVSGDATNTDAYYFYVAAANSTNISATDVNGNSIDITGTAANSGNSILLTITTSGDVTVVKSPDDTDSEAGIALAGSEAILGKFKFTSTNETMTVNKIQLLVVPTASATATSTASSDEVPTVKLYDGSTQIGAAAGYNVTGSGDNSGVVYITNLGWQIPKDTNKTLTVKGVLNTVSGGADAGASVYASVMAAGFESQGTTALDTTITAATGNQKVVYKTKPTLSAGTQPNTGNGSMTAGATITALRFKVAADSAGNVSWKKAVFQVAMANATMSAASTANVALKDVSTGNSLTLSTVYSGSTSTAGTTATITGGSTGYVGVELTTHEQISAGSSKDYDLQLTFSDISTTDNAASAVIKLYREENTVSNATWYAGISGAAVDTNMTPSFIWSDQSVTTHSSSTADWANGVFVKPGSFTDVVNSLQN